MCPDHQLPERVEGSRLLLRRWTPDDQPRLGAAVERNVGHLRPWMPWVADEPLPAGDRLALLHRWAQEWRDGGDVVMGIWLDGKVVGSTGLHRRPGPQGLEIGYWIDKDHLRQGLATETAAMLTSAALSLDGISFVEIHHDKSNHRSAGVPRRLGYRLVGESPAMESRRVSGVPEEVGVPGVPEEVRVPGVSEEVRIDCAWRMTEDAWRSRR